MMIYVHTQLMVRYDSTFLFVYTPNKKENRNSKLRTVGTRNISVLSNGENDLNLLADRKVKKASHLSKEKH